MQRPVFAAHDLVWIKNDVYAKNRTALEAVLLELRALGYTVDDMRQDKFYRREWTDLAQMEHDGVHLWHAHFEQSHVAKCGSCQRYIPLSGVKVHGHRCPECNEVIYERMNNGSFVLLQFSTQYKDPFYDKAVWMEVDAWDAQEGVLYLCSDMPMPQEAITPFTIIEPKQAGDYFLANQDKWEYVWHENKVVIQVKYSESGKLEHDQVEICNIKNNHQNYTECRILNGIEYSKSGDDFPFLEHLFLLESWHWAPTSQQELPKRLLWATGNVSDVSYYEGRDEHLGPEDLKAMRTFLQEFTSIDIGAWDRFLLRATLPEAIEDMEAFFKNF